MRHLLLAAAVAAATAVPFATPARADVGVSINLGEPGFYGRLDIGDFPPPQVIYRQPIAIEQVPVERPPVYLRVPPEHVRHWDRYCYEYHACRERVYFVQDDWYQREFVPRWRERHADRRHDDHDGRHEDHDRRHDDHWGGYERRGDYGYMR